VDLALDHISQSSQEIPVENVVPAHTLPYPLTSAFVYLLIHIHPNKPDEIEILLDKPSQQSKLLPAIHVLEHLVSSCFPVEMCDGLPDGISITGFTELNVKDSIVRYHGLTT
jgi:hypothetical protein